MTDWQKLKFWRNTKPDAAVKSDQVASKNRKAEGAAKTDGKVEVKLLPVILAGRDARVRSWIGRAVQTLAAVGYYAAVGIAIGVVILARNHIFEGLDELLRIHPTIVELLDHVGSAFIVSAIVVLMYEWGSETKHSLDLAGALAHALNNHIETILNASSHQAIANSMREIAGPESATFALQLTKFANAIRTLSEKEKDWAAPGYRDFVEWYHEQLTRYAHELADLSTNLRDDAQSRTEFRFVLPAATDVADVMLESVTKVMGANGKYYAISNAFTWTRLTRFRTAQQDAIRNGLEVERIFIVGTDPDEVVNLSTATKVLLGHHKDAAESPKQYKIKLIDRKDFERRAPDLPTHFGIFQPEDDTQTPVLFQVLDGTLTQFVMTGAAETSPILIAFEELWNDLPIELPASNGPEVIWDHFLAYRTRQLAEGDSVHAVLPIGVILNKAKDPGEETPPAPPSSARAASVAQPQPARWWPREFDKATIDPGLPQKVQIKRLFVTESTDEFEDKEVRRLLQRHFFKCGQRGYEWRVCLRRDLPESIRDQVPFVLIRRPQPDQTRPAIIEVVQPNQQDAFDNQSEKAELLFDGFNAAWDRAAGDPPAGEKPEPRERLEASVKRVYADKPEGAKSLLTFLAGDHGPVTPSK